MGGNDSWPAIDAGMIPTDKQMFLRFWKSEKQKIECSSRGRWADVLSIQY